MPPYGPNINPKKPKWDQNVNLAIDEIGLGGPSVHNMSRMDPIFPQKGPSGPNTKICQLTKSALEAQVPPDDPPKLTPKEPK